MISRMYRINCDQCAFAKRGVASIEEASPSKRKFRKLAKHLGWKRKRVENGSKWDFCPTCAEERKAAKKADGH